MVAVEKHVEDRAHCCDGCLHALTAACVLSCCTRPQDPHAERLADPPPHLHFERSRYGHGLLLAERVGFYYEELSAHTYIKDARGKGECGLAHHVMWQMHLPSIRRAIIGWVAVGIVSGCSWLVFQWLLHMRCMRACSVPPHAVGGDDDGAAGGGGGGAGGPGSRPPHRWACGPDGVH